MSNINYKDTCNIEHGFYNDIYVIAWFLQYRTPNNYGKLLQLCKLAEGLFMVSVNVIDYACLVIPDIGSVDTNIVQYINPRLS